MHTPRTALTVQDKPETIFVSPDEAAEMLNVSRTEAYGLIRAGAIASFRHGKRRLVSKRSIEAWAEAQLAAAGFGGGVS